MLLFRDKELLFCDRELLFVPDLSINLKTFHFPLCYLPAKPSRVFQDVFLTMPCTTDHRTLHFYPQIFKPVSRIMLRINFIIFFSKNRCKWCSRHLKCMSLNNTAYCIIITFLPLETLNDFMDFQMTYAFLGLSTVIWGGERIRDPCQTF